MVFAYGPREHGIRRVCGWEGCVALKPPTCTGLAILTPEAFGGIIRISEPEHSSVFVFVQSYYHPTVYTHNNNNNVCTN